MALRTAGWTCLMDLRSREMGLQVLAVDLDHID